jgi:hypothetical protein
MPQYDLHVLCPDCGGFHGARVRVSLAETFDVRRVSDVYDGKVPLEFQLSTAEMRCSITHNPVDRERPDLMVLVLRGRWTLACSGR